MYLYLENEIYKKYFPVKDSLVKFPEEDLNCIVLWTKQFRGALIVMAHNSSKVGMDSPYPWNLEEVTVLAEKLTLNKNLSRRELVLLNAILYSHKYKSFIYHFCSLFDVMPLLTDRVCKKYFADWL